ncbi:hypothetical protein CF326_g5863 [Tilletia indica]|nr:hypothetical protein CF326_g5863 [Tilletia indica]
MPKALRISIPSIPLGAIVPPLHPWAVQEAAERIAEVLSASKRGQVSNGGRPGRALVLTGAGISVDSGIAPYRGQGGHYEIHKSYRPIYYAEFSAQDDSGHRARQRYWNRSFLGFPPVRYARPNPAHMAIAAMQRMGYVPDYITQNVDSLHHSATPSPSLAAQTILELHGTLQHVVCIASPPEYTASLSASRPTPSPIDPAFQKLLLSYPPPPPLPTSSAFPTAQSLHNHNEDPNRSKPSSNIPPAPVEYNTPSGKSAYPLGCGFRGSRAAFQDELARLNPKWEEYGRELMLGRAQAAAASAHGEAGKDARGEGEGRKRPKMNPDGDVDLGDGVDYTNFKYPSCPNCGGVLKPAVIFFGETVPTLLKDRATSLVEQSSSMLVVGSSLATYSAFRLIKQALDHPPSSSSSSLNSQQRELMVLNIGPTRADPLLSPKAKMELGSSEVLSLAARLLAGGREKEDPVLRRLLEGGEIVRRDGDASSKVASS